jgi:OFA family oxalate/formate antiporter-like MFS transporter
MSKPTEKQFNRWIIVVGAVLVQFALGAIYSYTFILGAMKSYIDPTMVLDDPTRTGLGLLPFAFALLFFSLFMIPAGRLQDKKGPRLVAITGSIILTVGVVLAGIVALFPSNGSVLWMVVTFGMIGGAGIGFAYVCPIACATKWFPDKVGLVSGLAVAGFGAGSILFNFLYFVMINSASPAASLSKALVVCGILMGVMGLVGSIILHNPLAGYKPEGWEPPAPQAGRTVADEWTTKETLRTGTFHKLWVMYVFSAICGLMVIGNFKTYGASFDASIGTSAICVYILAVAGLCNAGGRIAWGKLSDRIGQIKTMKILFAVQAFAMTMFAIPNIIMWAIFGNLVYFCFGGNLALFPATTRRFYGAKNLGLNYALLFTAYGTAGVLGAMLASPMLKALSPPAPAPMNFMGYFILFAGMSLVSLVVSFTAKPPTRKTGK